MTDHPPPPTGDEAIATVLAAEIRALIEDAEATLAKALLGSPSRSWGGLIYDAMVPLTKAKIALSIGRVVGRDNPVVLAPDAARAVAALVAAVDAWNAIPNDWDDHDAETAIIKALADPALAALRRTLAGEERR